MKSRERGWAGNSCTEGLAAGELVRELGGARALWAQGLGRSLAWRPGCQCRVSTMGLGQAGRARKMKDPRDQSLPFSRVGLLSFENTKTTLTCELHGLQPHWDPQIPP